MSAKIGIGITTRNRPDILSYSLAHFAHFATENAKYVVYEDASEEGKSSKPVVNNYINDLDLTYVEGKTRKGIASAKNACLLELTDCDHIFLFDDDAWPRQENWANRWIECSTQNQVGHSMYIHDDTSDPKLEIFFIAQTIGEEPYLMDAWSNCMGVALHFNRDCLNALGGYDTLNSRSFYGYEHAQISVRSAKAGFTKGHRFLAPRMINEIVYSVDISHNVFHEPIPLTKKFLRQFKSSATPIDMSRASDNSSIMIDPAIYIPLTA